MTVRSDVRGQAFGSAAQPRILRGVRIPMRDGISLHAYVFLPADADRRAPVVMQMTPYGIDAFYPTGSRFTSRGLALALVDCRGRGDSGGEFEMFETDIDDTVDAIDWLSKQDWCDGQVAMYGGSYSGVNQWTAAKSGHPALKGIAPWGAGYPGIDVPPGGVPFIGHLSWYVLTAGRDTQWQAGGDSVTWALELADVYRGRSSIFELARRVGVTRPTFERVVRDPFYAMRAMTFLPTEAELRRIDLPILSSTGQYDSTHPGTIHHFLRHERFGSASARARHHLIVGPWHHAGMDGVQAVGDLSFAPQAKLDLGNLRLDWYRWVFGLGEKPAFLTHRVMHYMGGAEEWRGADSIEAASDQVQSWYLESGPGGQAGHVFRSGTLKAAPTGTGHDRFVADPFDTQIIELELGTRAITRPSKPDTSIVYPDPIRGMHFQIAGEDPTDAAFAFNLRGQGVVYHSEPLESDIEIAGLPQLEMWLTLSTPDTDIVALLYEILEEEGQSILLWSNILRLRYRESWQRPKLSVPGEAIRAEFFVPKFMSRRVRRGSRLRLVIRSPASIYYQKNLNTGKPVHEERSEDARRCEVWVHHERDRQTMLKLPVTRGQRAPT